MALITTSGFEDVITQIHDVWLKKEKDVIEKEGVQYQIAKSEELKYFTKDALRKQMSPTAR